MKSKTSFKDLDGWLKTLVVFGWISFVLFGLGLLIGVIEGILGI